ncbi:MAG TPA: hypothetical protein VKA19_05820, partial [Alphaproteobacteria bacterium]|nr:hypothetical protein [Alphaproteobacteria bacterium]
MTDISSVFPGSSTMNEPKFEFAFEVRLQFGHPQVIEHMPSGPAAGACIWGRKSDTMARYKRTADGGPVVDFSEYYFRTTPIFDVEQGKHDWLTAMSSSGSANAP